MKEITIHESVIEAGAFKGCKDLKKVILGSEVETIGDYAFMDCVNLQEIAFSDSIKRIESWAFQNCSSLKEIILPKSVEEVGNSVFEECTDLEVGRGNPRNSNYKSGYRSVFRL